MAKTKKNKNVRKVSKEVLKQIRNNPENHILKKTNREIEKLMGRISYLANYIELLMAYQRKSTKREKLTPDSNKKIDAEINIMIEEVQRLSLLAHMKNKTIKTKMIKNYNYETEPSCQ